MEYKISKELFEAIYGKNIISFGFCVEGDRGQTINYKKYKILFVDGKTKYVTINDFFFDCKEWAFDKGYELSSGYHIYGLLYSGEKTANLIYCDCRYLQINSIQVYRCWADSEQQAVFNIISWILENNSAKD